MQEQLGFVITILIVCVCVCVWGGGGGGGGGVGGGTAPPIGVGTWCRRWEEQVATNGGSSLYPLMSTYQQENLKGKL